MPRTRLAKGFAEIHQSDDPLETPPTASFKGHLTKYQYASASTTTKEATPEPAPTQRPAKRARTTVVAAINADSPRAKKKRKASSYADPSKYAHLSPLTDILEHGLVCVFVGTNPGVQTATAGHAYAHPSNHFWKLLYASGLTDRRLKPEEDVNLPALYCMGNTNIVDRPSKDAAELSKDETSAGTANLDAKFLKYKPESVCIVGKGIWEAILRYRKSQGITVPKASDFKYGWQDEKYNMGKSEEEILDDDGNVWKGSRVFVTTSTSGLAANLKPAEKEAIWKPFGEYVQKRRTEKGFTPRSIDAASTVV
ncbi:G/U mismatch-specific DNA glycosylase [Melanomma pulvis-pyrius CBS 109.77]|uniref:G/U mismatch-specific DNA glycosylase n=1 Tax=Melanomma pulvis-pyrius CBS 109.77 TaxID=1314802 RepID=A0A6A6WPM5_9PLEO|nr:G/U mismatch-specific DNA glycosylase [Melanomma pulvis-pyrius CBS 109.77]